MFNRAITSLLLPRPGKTLKLPDGGIVADNTKFDCDSTTVLSSGLMPVLFEHSYKATFIVPLEHFDYDGVAKETPNSAVVKGRDLLATLDEGLQGKVRIDFMQTRTTTEKQMVAQLTFTRKKSAAYFKLMLG